MTKIVVLKRPGLLTTVFLVTGSFTVIFLPGIYFLLGPRYLDTIYAGLVWFASLLTLTALFGFVLARRTIRDIRGIRREGCGPRIAKCQICDIDLPPAKRSRFKRVHGPHYQTVHAVAWKWNQKWELPWSLAMMTVMLLVLLSPLLLIYEYSRGSFLLGVFLPVAGVLSWILLYQIRKRKMNEFRRQWAADFVAYEKRAS